jgi:hypothetical protein
MRRRDGSRFAEEGDRRRAANSLRRFPLSFNRLTDPDGWLNRNIEAEPARVPAKAARTGGKVKPTRKISRRSFLTRVAGGAVAGGAAMTVLGGRAEALQTDGDPGDPVGRGRTGVTDSDSGSHADRAGYGRARRSGITDGDPGDPVGNGRGRRSGITDGDPGDPVGNGRGRRSGITDNDSGSNADPAGNGRGRRSCSDSDSGSYADPIGRGRRC